MAREQVQVDEWLAQADDVELEEIGMLPRFEVEDDEVENEPVYSLGE